jgi:hypothetical protein
VQLGRVTALWSALQGARFREYATVSLAFLFTRALVRLAGLRFNFVLDWMVLSDPEDLRTQLLETLYYSHAYPPGLNLLTGFVEKLGGLHAPALARATFQVFGLILAGSFYYLCKASGFRARAALAIALAFAVIPQSFYFEYLYHHTYPTAAILCLALALFHRALRVRSFGSWFGFFAACAALAWIRATFHLAWFAAMLLFALAFSERDGRRRLLVASALPAACIFALYMKNRIAFGVFGASTSGAATLTTVTVRRLPEQLRNDWIREGKLSPYAAVDVFAATREYAPFFATAENAEWPPMMNALDRPTVGAPNYNHWWYLEINPGRRHDSVYCLRTRPLAYASDVLENARRFFERSTEWHPLDKTDKSPHRQHRQVLGTYEEFYNTIVHGFPVPRVGLYAFLPFACAWALIRARSLVRRGNQESVALGAVLFCAILQIAFVIVTSILFTFGEVSRYRYEVESLIWVVMAIAARDLVAGVRRVVARRGLR